MERIGKVNLREIYYLNLRQDPLWHDHLPDGDWLLLAIAHEGDIHMINELSERCLDKNVCYICGTGPAGHTIEDVFDLEYLNRRISGQGIRDVVMEDAPFTSWHDKFEEALWFAVTGARHYLKDIKCIMCINLSPADYKNKISFLLEKIHQGWHPENNR